MRILFVDDDDVRHRAFGKNAVGHSVTHVYGGKAAVEALRNGDYDRVYLDHDLGGEESEGKILEGAEDGRWICRWIAENAARFPDTLFLVHSLNPPGVAAMEACLADAGLPVIRRPFAWRDEVS